MQISSTQYHDQFATDYDSMYDIPFMRLYNEITYSYIRDCLPAQSDGFTILDAGGGTGYWSIRLAKQGYQVVLSDISKGMLKVAENKITNENLTDRITIVEQDITDLNEFENETFGLCLAEGDPVSYCSDPVKAISELARVTRKNGYVAVSVDNKLIWAGRFVSQGLLDQADKATKQGIAPMHVKLGDFDSDWYPAHLFTIEELKRIFEAQGLKPVKEIGKPVFVSDSDCLQDETVFRRCLEFELEFSSLPSTAGCGKHIAVVGIKR